MRGWLRLELRAVAINWMTCPNNTRRDWGEYAVILAFSEAPWPAGIKAAWKYAVRFGMDR
jgi:hypothetical protein